MDMLEHPEISWALRTGYPSWMQESNESEETREYDEDAEYEAWRDAQFDD